MNPQEYVEASLDEAGKKVLRDLLARLRAEITDLKAGKCRCWKDPAPGVEHGHDTHCPEQATKLMDGYCKRIKGLIKKIAAIAAREKSVMEKLAQWKRACNQHWGRMNSAEHRAAMAEAKLARVCAAANAVACGYTPMAKGEGSRFDELIHGLRDALSSHPSGFLAAATKAGKALKLCKSLYCAEAARKALLNDEQHAAQCEIEEAIDELKQFLPEKP